MSLSKRKTLKEIIFKKTAIKKNSLKTKIVALKKKIF